RRHSRPQVPAVQARQRSRSDYRIAAQPEPGATKLRGQLPNDDLLRLAEFTSKALFPQLQLRRELYVVESARQRRRGYGRVLRRGKQQPQPELLRPESGSRSHGIGHYALFQRRLG